MEESISCIEYALLGYLEVDSNDQYRQELDQIRQSNGNHGN